MRGDDAGAARWGPRAGSRRSMLAVLLAAGLAVPLPGLAASSFTATTGNAGNGFAAASSFPTYPQRVLADGPTVYYRSADANGSTTAADSSGNGTTGAYVGTVPSFQQPGSPAGGSSGTDPAVLFPGTDNATAYAPASAVPAPSTFTMEAWFMSTATTASRFFDFGQNSTSDSFLTDRVLTLQPDGSLTFYVGSTTIASPAGGYNDGAWHQVAATFGVGGMQLYVDGGLVTADAGATVAQSYNGYWRLGGDTYRYYAGSLDEAAIYPTALSAATISAHRTAGLSAVTAAQYSAVVLANSPWGYWHLDDAPAAAYRATLLTPMADASGQGHDGSYYLRPQSLAAAPTGAMKGIQTPNGAMRFTGAGVGYDPVPVTVTSTFSLETWFRTTTTTGGKLLGLGNTTYGRSTAYDRQIYLRDDGTLSFGIWIGSASLVSSPGAYNDGSWHHVVGTAVPGLLVLYVDGRRVAANSSAGTAASSSGYWRWGGDSLQAWPNRPTSDFFNGDLDEVAFYPTTLSAQQVAWHYYANH